MNVFAIDTCNGFLNLGLRSFCGEFFYLSEESNKQYEEISESVGNILLKSNLSMKDVDCFVINIGPGSFTGVKIGISYLIGVLAAISGKNIIQIDTFDIMYFDFLELNSKFINDNISLVLKADAKNGVYIKKKDNILYLEDYNDFFIKHKFSEDLFIIEGAIFDLIDVKNKIKGNKFSGKGLLNCGLDKIKEGKKILDVKIITPLYIRTPY